MALLTLKNIRLAFSGPMLLDGASLNVEKGERICLIGRNGVGKSSLLRVIHGESAPDEGSIVREKNIRTALLPQQVPEDLAGSVFDIVASGHAEHAALLGEYHQASLAVEERQDASSLSRLSDAQHRLETAGAWRLHQQVAAVIAQTSLDPSVECSTLSAGLKRRVLLARALVNDPDILLLDEPTNHLDIHAIEWMESFLLRTAKTMIFVAHDRAFLKRLATRIVELDRAILCSFGSDYENYRERKTAMLETEAVSNATFDKRVASEEAWLRKGIRARRTRNEGRVRALLEMRAEKERRRTCTGNVRLPAQQTEKSGRLVLDVRNVSFQYVDTLLVSNFSLTVLRGEKVGIVGPNGCGKTTLLRILLGEVQPRAGKLRQGTRLEPAYFDQLRAQLDESRTVQENIVDRGDTVFVNNKPRHIIGYLQDFLFSPAQARSPITALSGGERNRLLLAKLFSRPSNLLVLDEPTNDLDPETLELFESMLLEYPGTVLMVSHDRAFLNNVASSLLVFEGEGRVQEYVGGYDDWLRQRPEAVDKTKPEQQTPRERQRAPRDGARKLTFKEQRELESLPDLIEQLEAEKQRLFERLADPALYRDGGSDVAGKKVRLQTLERELEAKYSRWEYLEEMALRC